MASLWPWLAVAGLGALHGLNPATGWWLAAASDVAAGDRRHALRALAPMAAGHLASVALVAGAVVATIESGVQIDPMVLQVAAAALLVVVLLYHLARPHRHHAPLRHTGMALWSFIVSTAHGAGWMLVPALTPLCLAGGPARELTASGSILLALGAIAVHMLAMLAAAGAMATATCRGVAAVRGSAWWARCRQACRKAR